MQQILRIQRRCKRKKVEFNVDEVFEEVCYPFYFHEEIKTLIERVKKHGKKATYDGIHLSSKNYYRDKLVEEMISELNHSYGICKKNMEGCINQLNSNELFRHETYPHHPWILRILDNYLEYSLMV